jgi:hypothetical protein
MSHDVDHSEVSFSEWQKFRREPPPHLIAEIIDRSEIGLPPWFAPLARGVAIASDVLLREAGHRPGMHRPRGWHKIFCDVFDLNIADGLQLTVRQWDNRGLWMVERFSESRQYNNADEILAHQFGVPIFTRSYQSAMRLAMHCHVNEPPPGLRWISTCPPDYLEGPGKRRIDTPKCARRKLSA